MNEYNYNQMFGMPGPPGYQDNFRQFNRPQPNAVNTNKVYVNGIQDVYNKYLPAVSDFIYVDNNDSVLYQKIVDVSGKAQVKMFDIVPRENDKPTEYVSRQELETLKSEIAELKQYLPKVTNSGGNNEPVK